VNFYKVRVPGEESPAARIFLNEGGASQMIPFPNPVHRQDVKLNLRIFNTNNQLLVGKLLNEFGIVHRDLEITTTADLATLEVDDLRNGLYIVWLTDGFSLFRCKFIINRQ
jgi:hypothetical protein